VPLVKGEKESDEDPQYNLTDYEKKFYNSFLADPNSLSGRALNMIELKGIPTEQMGNHRKIREVEMPSSNGITNSRSMAVLAGVCLENGSWEGKSIFKNPSTFQELSRTFNAYNPDKISAISCFWLSQTPFYQFANFKTVADNHNLVCLYLFRTTK